MSNNENKPLLTELNSAARELLGTKNTGFTALLTAVANTILRLDRAADRLNKEKERLRKIAYYDSLTGLPNRALFNKKFLRLFNNTLKNIRASNGNEKDATLTLVVFDLNGFKTVNDTHGHVAGDRFLKKVAKILRECVRDDDFLGTVSSSQVVRHGGDEFCLLLPGVLQTDAEKIVSRIAGVLAKKKIYASFGIGTLSPATMEAYDGYFKAFNKQLSANEFFDVVDKKGMYASKGKKTENNAKGIPMSSHITSLHIAEQNLVPIQINYPEPQQDHEPKKSRRAQTQSPPAKTVVVAGLT